MATNVKVKVFPGAKKALTDAAKLAGATGTGAGVAQSRRGGVAVRRTLAHRDG